MMGATALYFLLDYIIHSTEPFCATSSVQVAFIPTVFWFVVAVASRVVLWSSLLCFSFWFEVSFLLGANSTLHSYRQLSSLMPTESIISSSLSEPVLVLRRGCSISIIFTYLIFIVWISYYRELCGCLTTYVIINDYSSKLGQWGIQKCGRYILSTLVFRAACFHQEGVLQVMEKVYNDKQLYKHLHGSPLGVLLNCESLLNGICGHGGYRALLRFSFQLWRFIYQHLCKVT